MPPARPATTTRFALALRKNQPGPGRKICDPRPFALRLRGLFQRLFGLMQSRLALAFLDR
jgi:hypothetical protein